MNAKITGIKKAVGDFNHWQGHATIMYDSSDNTVWTDVFTSDCSFTQYYSDSIVCLLAKSTCTIVGRDNTTTMAEIKSLIESL